MSKIIDLSDKNYEMERNGYIYKIIAFRKDTMNVDTNCYLKGNFIKKEKIPYAQLTKKLKNKIK